MTIEIISRADAKASSFKRYFTGEPCKHGHVSVRLVSSGVCITCRADIEDRWKKAHPEKQREKLRRQAARHRSENPDRVRRNKRNWELANPEKVQERIRRWEELNPDRRREIGQKWRDGNPGKIAKKNKTYKIANADRLKPINLERVNQWRKDNPEAVTKNSNARRARKKNAPGSHTTQEIKDLLERQNFKCAACGTDIKKKRHLDHIIALSREGSTNYISNLQWLCPGCNLSKNNKDPLVWARENGRLV